MIRRESVAGEFYKGNFEDLDKEVQSCFTEKQGPGAFPISKQEGKVYGVITPHAGYEYSGQGAAWAYKEIAESIQPDLFVIIGVDHRGRGKNISFSLLDFQTPMGIAKNDKDFTKHLIEKTKKINSIGEKAGIDEMSHEYEHSIEVQLPFLSFISQEVSFVPILLSNCTYDDCKNLAMTIGDVAKQLNKKICIIASSDFTHYGHYYDFIPFKEKIKENLYDLDLKVIEKILKFNTKEFIEESKKTTICGKDAIACCIEACKQLGSKKAELLHYYTSGDIINDYKTAVGYAAIVFK